MGVDNSILSQRSKRSLVLAKLWRKKSKKKSSEELDYNSFNNLKGNINKYDSVYESKSFSMKNLLKEESDKEIGNMYINYLNKLNSLSAENLTTIEEKNCCDENSDESLETNYGSNKSKEDKKMLKEESYDDIYDDINSDEDDDIEEQNEKDEDAEEKRHKELIVTNNMKAVFIDSKSNAKEQNENINENISRLSTLSMTTFDYELNFYRNGNDIRQSYFTKLISSQVWTPNMKPKKHNSIIIFDWDDTLLPTSFLTKDGVTYEDLKISKFDEDTLMKLDQIVLKILTEAVEKGNVYIITNAGKGWLEYSASMFYPSVVPILKKIKIISARDEYEKMYPGDSRQWKIEAFLNLQKNLNLKLVTNIICLGDSLYEMEAGRILASRFTEAFIKTVKFKEAPNLDELLKQLKVVSSQFGIIYSRIKNLTIRVEKKKKEECL